MKLTRRGFLLVGTLLVATSCFISRMPTQSGRPIDMEFVRSMVKGQTTIAEVEAKLGKPMSVTETADTQTWLYSHWTGKPAMFGASYESSTTQLVTIQFRDGKVVEYTISTAGR